MTDHLAGHVRMSTKDGCQTPNGSSCIEIYNGKEWQVMHSSWHHIYRFMMDYMELSHVEAEEATQDFLDEMTKLGFRVMP